MDAHQWEVVRPKMGARLIGAAASSSRWVVVGRERIATSTNGADWSWATVSGETFNDVAWNGRRWVAVGADGVIRWSAGAVTWEEADSGTDEVLHAVAPGGSRWVVAGEGGVILSSRNGRDWSKSEFDSNFSFNAVAWDGRRFQVVGDDEVLFSYSDGLNFTSADGRHWSRHRLDEPVVDVGSNATASLAVGYEDVVVSPEGGPAEPIGWIYELPSQRLLGTEPTYALTWDGAEWVGIFGKEVSTSPDGAAWTQVWTSPFALNDVASSRCNSAPS